MKIAYFGIFSSVASYTISAISHRSALKKSIFDAMISQPSMTKAEMMELWAEKLPENFLKTGRFSFRKEKPSGNRKQGARFSHFRKYHRRNRFWFSNLTKKKNMVFKFNSLYLSILLVQISITLFRNKKILNKGVKVKDKLW